MSGDAKAKDDLNNQAAQALETQTKLAAADAQKKKDAEAAASPTPPAS